MNRNRIFLFLSVLFLSMLACSIFVGGPEFPEERISISAESVESLRTQMEEAILAGAQTGAITLQITEEQLTSALALKLAAQENPAFTDPQVHLRNGQMQIYGRLQRGYFLANLLIILDIGIDEQGKPTIEIATADFGPFPTPEGLKQSLTTLVTEAYTGSLGPVATGFRLETINITDGVMTFTGRIK